MCGFIAGTRLYRAVPAGITPFAPTGRTFARTGAIFHERGWGVGKTCIIGNSWPSMNAIFRLGDVPPRKYFLAVAIALGLLFAMLGPEGTTARGPVWAVLQWLAQSILPMALAIGAHLVLHRSSRFDQFHPWLKLFLSGSLGALVFSPLAYGLDLVLGAGEEQGARGHLAGWLDELAGVYLPVTFAWVLINIPFTLGYEFRRLETPPQPESRAAPVVQPPVSAMPFFMTLLSPPLRAEVISLKSELHYLSVVTTTGRDLILYTLRDAVRELPPDAGLMVHRSYWVNKKHVVSFAPRGRLAIVKMSDGSEIPVSRAKLKEAKQLLVSK